VLAGAHDHTVRLRGVRQLAEGLGGGSATLRVLPGSAHLLGIDADREACAEEVLAFVRALGPSGADADRSASAAPSTTADPSPGRE
jgi:carboxylesterase